MRVMRTPTETSGANKRRGERGAALISALLLAMLLLTAGGALVLTTTMSATNAIDSTAEMQAYYGAEAGLHATINVLRGNVWAADTTPKASFRSAVEPDESNYDGDEATDRDVARLSNWLAYNDNERVVVPGSSDLIAYDVSVRDADDSKTVSYSTSVVYDVGTSGCTAAGSALTCTASGVNAFTLTYTPQPVTSLSAYPAVANQGLGSFTLTRVASGATIPADKPVILRLSITQTLPWARRATFIAKITGDVAANTATLTINFSGKVAKADGTQYELEQANPVSVNHPVAAPPGTTALSVKVTAPQPKRIVVRTTGYGPKGAVKKLEMVVKNTIFDFEAPATLTMVGAANCSAPTFDSGSSGAKDYSGVDNYGTGAQLPAFAVTGCDVQDAYDGIKKHETVVDPEIGYLDSGTVPAGTTAPSMMVPTPSFLSDADEARETLDELQAAAESMGRYYKPVGSAEHTVTAANTAANKITFVDGNCEIEGGSGLVVVTGKLEMHGNPNFSGVILVLGQGEVERDGGGDGIIYGALVVAAFNRNGNGGFSKPSFITNGGGNSRVQYDSQAVAKAVGSLGVSFAGVREY